MTIDEAVRLLDPQMPEPYILLKFNGPADLRFEARFSHNVLEGQFLVAGSELLNVSQKLRDLRLAGQLQPVNIPSPPPVNPPAKTLVIETR